MTLGRLVHKTSEVVAIGDTMRTMTGHSAALIGRIDQRQNQEGDGNHSCRRIAIEKLHLHRNDWSKAMDQSNLLVEGARQR